MKLKKPIIIAIITINILTFLNIFYVFYYKKASFDTSVKAEVPTEKITKVYSDVGTWYLNNQTFDFYKKHSIKLNKNEISEFCNIINASHAKYIDNVRPDYWIDINIETIDKKDILITLNQNKSDGFFFTIDYDDNFEGKDLADFIVKHIHSNQ